MEILVILFLIVVIVGALAGGKSFGGTIARGIGCVILIGIIFYFVASGS